MNERRGSRGSLRPGALIGLMIAGALASAGASASPDRPAPVHAEGPPLGHTGGFGEPTCRVCHAEYDVNVPGGVLALEGWPERYRPGERYTLTVVLDAEGTESAGFQLAVRDDRGRQAGRLDVLDPRAQVRDSAGVSYAHQTADGAAVAAGRTASWTLVWTAPSEAHDVHVDLAANSANGDNSPFGDLIYQRRWSARPATQR